MDWTTILNYIIGGGGLLTFTLSVYKARPEKVSFEIKNLRELVEEIKTNAKEEKIEYEEKMSKLERKVDELELKDEIKSRAIAQYLRCSYPPTDKECPVAVFINRSEDIMKRKTKELKEKRETNEQ